MNSQLSKKKFDQVQYPSLKASNVANLHIAKKLKSFSDGNFIKTVCKDMLTYFKES